MAVRTDIVESLSSGCTKANPAKERQTEGVAQCCSGANHETADSLSPGLNCDGWLRWQGSGTPLNAGLVRPQAATPLYPVDHVPVMGGGGSDDEAPSPTRGTPYGLDSVGGDPTILEIAQHIAGASRSRDYGHPYENHKRIADIWNTQLAPKLKPGYKIEPREVALMMIGLKLARETNTPKLDNLVDIAGYVQCLDMIDTFENQQKEDADVGAIKGGQRRDCDR